MIDPYDPHHPDGPDDGDDLPGPPANVSWLDDDDPADEEWSSPFRPHVASATENATESAAETALD
jgi:hypothetical protein